MRRSKQSQRLPPRNLKLPGAGSPFNNLLLIRGRLSLFIALSLNSRPEPRNSVGPRQPLRLEEHLFPPPGTGLQRWPRPRLGS